MSGPDFQPMGAAPRPQLQRLFDEEARYWKGRLRWSFDPTRKRIQSALDEGTLKGLTAADAEGVCAYATWALEDGRGTVGSFFAAERSRSQGIEKLLLERVLDQILAARPSVVDCQTLFSSDPGLAGPFAERGFQSAARLYMTLNRRTWSATGLISPGPPTCSTFRTDVPSVARLVYEAHRDSRDLDASSSFDDLDSCEKLLRQIVIDDVCGPFDTGASRRVEEDGRSSAVCLLTWPLAGMAHVSEVATSPSRRRQGLARRCLTDSLARVFGRDEAEGASLSVTASNQAAISLYESLGFAPLVQYQSHVRRLAP